MTGFDIIDVLSKLFTVAATVTAVVAFVFRKSFSAWIDSRFKKRLDVHLAEIQAAFAHQLEQKKAALAKEFETYKRELDARDRRQSRVADKKFEAYEIYHSKYGEIISALYALHFLDQKSPAIDPKFREFEVMRVFSLLDSARIALQDFDFYIDTNHGVRIATLFRDLSHFISDGAQDKKRLDELALEKAKIGEELKRDLLGT